MQRIGTRFVDGEIFSMKNLLIFYAILSVSVFAGNRKIRQLESTSKENSDLHGLTPSQSEEITHSTPAKKPDLQELATKIIQAGDYEIQHLVSVSNDYNEMVFIVSAAVSKDSGKIEKIHLDFYDGGHFLERQNIEMESLLQDGFTYTLDQTEIFTIWPTDFVPEKVSLQLKHLYLKGFYKVSLVKNKNDGVWMLANEDGQRIETLKITAGIQNMSMNAKPLSKLAEILPSSPTENLVLQRPVTTKIIQSEMIKQNKKYEVSLTLELSPEGEIHAILFNMYKNDQPGDLGRLLKKRILLKNLFKETFNSPKIYIGSKDSYISPISFHPLNFNPKDGGTFAIRYKNRHFFKSFSTSKEVILSLIQDRGEWILTDEERRPINELWIRVINPRTVNKIVADWHTLAERELKIHSCEKSARALL